MSARLPVPDSVLRQDYDALLRDHAALREQLTIANARIGALTTEIGRLAEAVARGNDRIGELVALAQNKRRPTASSPPSPSPPSDISEAAQDAFANRPVAPVLPERIKPAKKPRRPTGRKPLPEHLPVDEHIRRPDACEQCGGTDLDLVDEVIEQKLHVVKEHQRCRRVCRKTGRCRACGERTTAPSLPAPFPRSKVTCEWLAWLVHQKFAQLTPLDRLRRDLGLRGIPLAMSFLVSQIERAADLLAAIDGEHWKQLLAGNWMATDATSIAVLIPGLPGSHYGHIEVFRRDDLVVFQYEANKGGEILAQKLAAFAGTLVADAEHRHNATFATGRVSEAGCNAHGRRKLSEAEGVQPVLAAEGGAFIAAIYVAEAEAKAAGLKDSALLEWRQVKVPPIREDLRRWMDVVEPTLTPNDALAKVIRYYRNHWDALFRFVDHPEIPIDNSASEREFQHVAKMRLNSLFAGSTEGAHRAATLLGIVATCRAIGVHPEEYLGWAFTRTGTHKSVFGLPASALTPAAFKRSRAGPTTI